jgi:hypothetical protein
MRKLFRFPFVVMVCVLCASMSTPLSAQTKQAQPSTVQNKAMTSALTKAQLGTDIAVACIVIELLSTTKGQAGVEFPTDRLKITGIIKDIGGGKVPAGFKVKLTKNLTTVIATTTIPVPTAKGQIWSVVHEDTYVHDRAPYYQIAIEAQFGELSTTNNKRGLTLNDQTLHAQGKQETNDTTIGGIQVPGGVVILF